jgi:serine phosphatase RsbU (regulator of sigma subunit)
MKSLLKRRQKRRPPAIEPVPSSLPGLRGAEMAAVFSGPRRSGDFYGAARINPSRVVFGLLDLPARRESNERLLAVLQGVFQAGAQLLKSPGVNEPDALIELCLQLNRAVIETAGIGHSSPAFGGCYNEDLGTVCYFNAGHTPGLVRDTSNVSELGATGLPLGLFSHVTSDARMIALEPGAALLLVSQSVVAAKRNGEQYGLRRVEETLKTTQLVNAHHLCAAVLQAAESFARKPQPEDMTALALVRHRSTG